MGDYEVRQAVEDLRETHLVSQGKQDPNDQAEEDPAETEEIKSRKQSPG